MNPALQSRLVPTFTREAPVTLDAGFDCMATAAGRLPGTLLSGLIFQVGGWH